MLCFVFSALAVVLDQLFKRWAVITLAGGTDITLIPGILGLTYAENTGAAFGIFPNMRWVLAGIALVCTFILIMILLRYNGGFWSRLGLAAVLGGAVGNLADRVFRSGGVVVDMFEFKFFNFAIFNVADIFLTVGGLTFCVFYIIAAAKESRAEKEAASHPAVRTVPRSMPEESVQKPRVLPKPEAMHEPVQRPVQRPVQKPVQRPVQSSELQPPGKQAVQNPPRGDYAKRNAPPQPERGPLKEPMKTDNGEYQKYLQGLASSKILEEFDLDKLMAEYGLNDKKD